MPLTKQETELRERARRLIEQDLLPANLSVRVWGGYGSMRTCSVCGRTVKADEIEYEVEETIGSEVRQYRFHFMCHAAWQFECARADFLRNQSKVRAE